MLTSSGLLGGSRVQGLGHEGMEKKLRTIQSLLYDVLLEASRVALQQPKGGTNCFFKDFTWGLPKIRGYLIRGLYNKTLIF